MIRTHPDSSSGCLKWLEWERAASFNRAAHCADPPRRKFARIGCMDEMPIDDNLARYVRLCIRPHARLARYDPKKISRQRLHYHHRRWKRGENTHARTLKLERGSLNYLLQAALTAGDLQGAWDRAKAWYRQAESHAPKPSREDLQAVMMERIDLNAKRQPQASRFPYSSTNSLSWMARLRRKRLLLL